MSLTTEILMELHPEPRQAQRFVTRAMAQRLAAKLSNCPRVNSIELFGSVAAYGCGEDLDLIITADVAAADEFARQLSHISPDACPYREDIKSVRLGIALSSLPGLLECFVQAGSEIEASMLDLFIFPVDWRERPDEVQASLKTWDRGFVSRIASYAQYLHRK